MPRCDYVVVDAFADRPFAGNPAGVVLDANPLTDEQMQAIAREIHLSETVFVLASTRPNAAVRFRTFTPTVEGSVSGHAILAGVSALIRDGRFIALLDEPGMRLPIETPNGLLSVRAERIRADHDEFLVWLNLPSLLLTRYPHDPAKTAGLLGLDPAAFDDTMPGMKTQDGDILLFVQSYSALMEARPDFLALAEYSRRRKVRIWCVATRETLADSVQVQSRCFAPVVGIDEDPVTASIHGPLGVYLVVAGEVGVAGDRAAVNCVQSDSTGRAGLARVLVGKDEREGYEAWVGGQCWGTMTGQIHVPG